MRKVEVQFGSGPLQQRLSVGDLHFLSDSEVSRGGDGTGPSPHELLAAALGACTGMTLKMYAERKQWSLQNAIISVDIVRENNIERFIRTIQLIGDLNQEQKERFIDIANKCPIHKALSGEIEIQTECIAYTSVFNSYGLIIYAPSGLKTS